MAKSTTRASQRSRGMAARRAVAGSRATRGSHYSPAVTAMVRGKRVAGLSQGFGPLRGKREQITRYGKKTTDKLGQSRRVSFPSVKSATVQNASRGQSIRTNAASRKVARREFGASLTSAQRKKLGPKQAANRVGQRRKGFLATKGATKTGARRGVRRTPRAPKVISAARRAVSGRRWNAAVHPRASNGRFRKK